MLAVYINVFVVCSTNRHFDINCYATDWLVDWLCYCVLCLWSCSTVWLRRCWSYCSHVQLCSMVFSARMTLCQQSRHSASTPLPGMTSIISKCCHWRTSTKVWFVSAAVCPCWTVLNKKLLINNLKNIAYDSHRRMLKLWPRGTAFMLHFSDQLCICIFCSFVLVVCSVQNSQKSEIVWSNFSLSLLCFVVLLTIIVVHCIFYVIVMVTHSLLSFSAAVCLSLIWEISLL